MSTAIVLIRPDGSTISQPSVASAKVPNRPIPVKDNPKVVDWVKSNWKYHSLREKYARLKLENSIKDLIDLANGHISSKLPLGSPQYKQIYAEVTSEVLAYAAYWNLDSNEILAKAPAIQQLKTWAETDPKEAQILLYRKYVTIAFWSVLVVSILVGFCLALIHHSYNVFMHFNW